MFNKRFPRTGRQRSTQPYLFELKLTTSSEYTPLEWARTSGREPPTMVYGTPITPSTRKSVPGWPLRACRAR